MPNDLDDLQNKKNPSDDLIEEGIDEHSPTQSPAIAGEESASGTASIPTSDDNVGDMVEGFTGEEPELGELPSDMVNEAERNRRIGKDEEDIPREPGVERLEDLEEPEEEEPSEMD